MFDPVRIADDACAEGHLDVDPVFQVLLTLGQRGATGRLTVVDGSGDNHLFFMQGRPVGVQLAERVHPLGQLLLELGRVDGATFLRAQRLIAQGGRVPGQVFKELGVVDDASLKDTLAIQARRKAEHFCRLGSRPFTFCKGLTYLTGFASTPLDLHGVIYLAIRQQTGEQMREAWLEDARLEQVRLVVPGAEESQRPVDHLGLPAAPAAYGFGPPEERFLQRLLAGWESVAALADTGTLPREEMATLLRYLEIIGRLQRRPVPPAAPATPATPPTPPSHAMLEPLAPFAPLDTPLSFGSQGSLADGDFGASDVTVPELRALPVDLPDAPTPLSFAPLSASVPPPPVFGGTQPRPDGRAPMPALAEPSFDDVFSRSDGLARRAPLPAGPPDTTAEPTAPRRPAIPRPTPPPVAPAPPLATPPLAPAPAGTSNPALHEPTPPVPGPAPLVDDVAAPIVRKKKTKRTEPLPSSVTAVTVSETRREKTMIAPLPSIVIDDD